jgi:hypothetical protein
VDRNLPRLTMGFVNATAGVFTPALIEDDHGMLQRHDYFADVPKGNAASYWRRTFAAGPGFHRLPVPRRSNLIFASIGQKLICSRRVRAWTIRWSCCLWTA